MGFTKDLWHATAVDAEGSKTRVRTARYGNGKRWLAVWRDPDGRERSKAFERQVDADRHWRSQETDVARGDYVDPNSGREPLSDMAGRWLRSRMVDPSSAIRYETAYRLHVEPTFGGRQVKSIKPSEVAEWLTGLGERYGASTARLALLVLQGGLELAVEDGSIRKNPARSKVVQRPSSTRPNLRAWSDETVNRIIDAHPALFRPIPIIGAACGERQGEIFALAEEDIDYDSKVIHVRRQIKKLGSAHVFALPKNDRERIVPMPDWAAESLRDFRSNHTPAPYSLPWEKPGGPLVTVNLLFRWTDERHIRARGYDELVWKPALAATGVIANPTKDGRGRLRYDTDRTTGMHALRHYYASVTLADGVSIADLAEFLGHADPAFTLRIYTHFLPSSHERARRAIDGRMFRPGGLSHGSGAEQSLRRPSIVTDLTHRARGHADPAIQL